MAFDRSGFGYSPRRSNTIKNIAIGILSVALLVTLIFAFSVDGNLASVQKSLSSISSSYNQSQSALARAQTNLTSAVNITSSTLSRIQSQNSTIANLSTQLEDLESLLSSTQYNSSVFNSTIATLESQIASQNGTISQLKSQNVTIQSLLGLKNTTVEASNLQFNETALGSMYVTSFSAPYAGYLTVSGTTNSTGAAIVVYDTSVTLPIVFNFTSGSRLVIPVLPGSVSVNLNNKNNSSNLTGSITVNYTD